MNANTILAIGRSSIQRAAKQPDGKWQVVSHLDGFANRPHWPKTHANRLSSGPVQTATVSTGRPTVDRPGNRLDWSA